MGDTTEMVTTYNFKSVFTQDQEAAFSDYIKVRAKMAYGLTREDVRKAAYEFALANNLKFPNQWNEKRMAGEKLFNISVLDEIS